MDDKPGQSRAPVWQQRAHLVQRGVRMHHVTVKMHNVASRLRARRARHDAVLLRLMAAAAHHLEHLLIELKQLLVNQRRQRGQRRLDHGIASGQRPALLRVENGPPCPAVHGIGGEDQQPAAALMGKAARDGRG